MEQGLQLDFLLLHGDISCLCWWIFLSEEEKWEVETDQIPFHHPAPNLQEDFFFYGKIEIPLSQTQWESWEGNMQETSPILSRGLESLLKGRDLPKEPHFGQREDLNDESGKVWAGRDL